jgi:hypothetical protein
MLPFKRGRRVVGTAPAPLSVAIMTVNDVNTMENLTMHLHPPSIAPLADRLPGHTVILADGDEIGVVAEVVETPATVSNAPSHALVVQVDQPEDDTPSDPLVVSAESVLAVTDDAVVLGTTAPWLSQHELTD